jgi:hypothetical protein
MGSVDGVISDAAVSRIMGSVVPRPRSLDWFGTATAHASAGTRLPWVMTAIHAGLVVLWVPAGFGNVSWWQPPSIRSVIADGDTVAAATRALFTAFTGKAALTGGDVNLVLAVVVGVTALAGVVYSSVLQRRTGRETVREARKAAEAALASAAASDKAAEASAAAVREARTADAKLQVWRQREETMRMVRWGLEQTASTNPKAATIGQNTLTALQKGSLVQPADTAFVATVTGFVAGLVDDVVDTEVENALSGYHPDDDFELNNGITD